MTAARLVAINAKSEIHVEDLGVTLRRIFAAAVTGYAETQQRNWKLVYKSAVVGSVRVKDQHLKGKAHNARHQNGAADRAKEPKKSDSREENLDASRVAVVAGSPKPDSRPRKGRPSTGGESDECVKSSGAAGRPEDDLLQTGT